jgi:KUP system potassium uptake protein
MVGAAPFYGDGIITPPSRCSARFGSAVATPAFEPYVVPFAITILVGLFLVQRRGTGGMGKLFGPVMCIWFATSPLWAYCRPSPIQGVLRALHPIYAVTLFARYADPSRGVAEQRSRHSTRLHSIPIGSSSK